MEPGLVDAERACLQLILNFAHAIDHHRFDEVAGLFTREGTFERPGVSARGHGEIAALWAGRPASTVTRHVCGTPLFTSTAAEEIRAVTYFTLYQGHHEGDGVPDLSGPAAVAEYVDCFRPEGGCWKIASRKVVVGFMAKG